MAGFSLTGGSGQGFNLGGSGTEGFSLGAGETSNPGSIYALDTPMAATGGSYAGYYSDELEASKLSQFYPVAQTGESWWEGLAKYGVTRAIDSHFGPPAPNKTLAGATYAGQNGQTYTAGQEPGGIMGDPLMLLVLVGVGFVVMS